MFVRRSLNEPLPQHFGRNPEPDARRAHRRRRTIVAVIFSFFVEPMSGLCLNTAIVPGSRCETGRDAGCVLTPQPDGFEASVSPGPIVKNLFVLLCVFPLATTVFAHEWPTVQVCEAFHGCKDDISKLTADETKTLNQLLNSVKPGANEHAITVALGEDVYRRNPETQSLIGKPGTIIGLASWSTSSKHPLPMGPGVDVLFINRKATVLKWWISWPGFGRYVRAIGPDNLGSEVVK